MMVYLEWFRIMGWERQKTFSLIEVFMSFQDEDDVEGDECDREGMKVWWSWRTLWISLVF